MIIKIGRPVRSRTKKICGGAAMLSALFSLTAAVTPSKQTYCFSPATTVGAWFLVRIQDLGTSTAAPDVATRSFLGLPAAPITSIVGVTDESKCLRASRALDSAQVGVPANSSLYLVQVGTHYMAFPPSTDGVMVHLDNLFTVKKSLQQQQ